MKTTYADVVLLCFGLGLSWHLYFVWYRDYTTDFFRQRMFELRDSLFDYAADGKIEFDNSAYTLLRTTMNGFLRYGHRISFFELFIFSIFTKNKINKNEKFSEKWENVIKKLPKNQREDIEKYRKQMNNALVIQAFAGSPLFICTVVAPFVAFVIPGKIHEKLREKFFTKTGDFLRIPIDRVETTAFVYGKN